MTVFDNVRCAVQRQTGHRCSFRRFVARRRDLRERALVIVIGPGTSGGASVNAIWFEQ